MIAATTWIARSGHCRPPEYVLTSYLTLAFIGALGSTLSSCDAFDSALSNPSYALVFADRSCALAISDPFSRQGMFWLVFCWRYSPYEYSMVLILLPLILLHTTDSMPLVYATHDSD